MNFFQNLKAGDKVEILDVLEKSTFWGIVTKNNSRKITVRIENNFDYDFKIDGFTVTKNFKILQISGDINPESINNRLQCESLMRTIQEKLMQNDNFNNLEKLQNILLALDK